MVDVDFDCAGCVPPFGDRAIYMTSLGSMWTLTAPAALGRSAIVLFTGLRWGRRGL